MSTWHVIAIERLGPPSPRWPSIYGPAAGGTVTANGLRTLDLTPFLTPLNDFSAKIERDLTSASFSNLTMDFEDSTGLVADEMGPGSSLLATEDRYFGPWIQVIERWGDGEEALRFLGYIDETSIEWNEDEAKTGITVLHASDLLKERLITDFPEFLRPWPSVPTNASQDFHQSTADALLDAATEDFTPRSTATDIEAALWAQGKLSWIASIRQLHVQRAVYHVDQDPTLNSWGTYYAVPTAPASSVIIDGTAYAVDHLEWDTSIEGTVEIGDPAENYRRTTYHPVRIILQGAPDLTGHLHLGDTVVWGIPESQRTHYLAGAIPEPVSGSDGQKFVDLNTVEQLAPGDVLTLTFLDSSSGAPRTSTADLPPIIDMDGETGRVFLSEPVSQGYAAVSKVRRNSQDPVLFDGLAYAKALVAPFVLSDSAFVPAPTDVPVLVFRPYDAASPRMYGVHNLQTLDQAGTLLVARRGASNGSGSFPTAGTWAGSWSGSWGWQGMLTADATHRIYGDVLQFPGGVNGFTAPVIYVEGDLSASAATPPNGWRQAWRSWKSLEHITQDPESTWNGTAVTWDSYTASGDVPALVVHFAASTPSPGRYARTAGGVWTFQAHTANATLGSSSTPAITGTYPTGNTLALGMGIRANGDEEEALLALVATGSSFPFTALSACLLSQASGGDLTVRQTAALWATGSIPAGPWALGGGLVVQSWEQTIGSLKYPHTVLHKLNGSTVVTADLKTLEVIPQTIQPLLRTGAAGARVIGGWYALALETFEDSNYAAARRLQFLHLDQDLQVINGIPEVDPSTPTDLDAYFSRGETIASIVPDGAIIARMVRTSNTADEMAGLIGGRLFTVANVLPTTVERLKIGASTPSAQSLSVAGSGDGMSVSTYLEKFAGIMMATAVPTADGNIALVSRSHGTLRTRTFGTYRTSVQATERGPMSKTQVWEGYIRLARITYQDLFKDKTASVEVQGTFSGGRIVEWDVSDLVCSITMSRALGQACVYWFGQPAAVISESWVDRSGGTTGAAAPVWWANWSIGDRVVLESFTPPATVTAWKLIKLAPGAEDRSASVELRRQPFPLFVEA